MDSQPKVQLDINSSMVALARETRGFTQSTAASLLGISQAYLSKIEAGLAAPLDGAFINEMARVYHYPTSFFSTKYDPVGADTSEFFHRKRQATSRRALRQIYAQLNITIVNVRQLLKTAEIKDSIPQYDPEKYEPAEIARIIRSYWSMPPGPVDRVVDAIENAGGIVLLCDFGNPHVDALSRSVPGLPRLFFVNRDMPGDRQRLTLAHELGHVIMHKLPNQDMEHQAYEFAAEFLMPESEIKSQFSRVDIPKLAAMKPYWKVSMAALLKRAQELGKISERMARERWMQMSAAGYRKREPAGLDIEIEQPRLFREIIQFHQEKTGMGLKDLSELMLLCEDEVKERYEIEDLTLAERPVLHRIK